MNVHVSCDQIDIFQEKIFKWYQNNKRDLPWRNTDNVYHIFVSEIMLQQTQVSRVLSKFMNFIEHIPNFYVLCNIDKRSLFALWSGLGFNKRALMLQKSAHIIVNVYNGNIPRKRSDLLHLPGVGRYTSSALLSFVYNDDVVVIDTNIRRVLMYELGLPLDISLSELENIASLCLPKGKSRERHYALMDYGSLVCTANKTNIRSQYKQSSFIGSDRQVRGWIIKHLVQQGKIHISDIKQNFPDKNIENIVLGLVKDNMVLCDEGGNVVLSKI